MKKRNIFSVLFIIVLFLVSMTGCAKNKDEIETAKKSIYYVDSEEKKLVTKEYDTERKSGVELVESLLRELTQDRGECLRAIPEYVKINGFDLTDGIASIDFSTDYTEMSKERELLLRAAVVQTLAQNEEIDFVFFTINSIPLKESDGSVLGAMKAEDFIADLGGGNNVNASSDFTLYYGNQNGSKLKEYKLINAKYGKMSKERYIVDQLIKGPDMDGYTATLSPNITLQSIVTANNICYVDFDSSFLTEQSEVPNNIVIYSIVNSLSEIDEIHRVQISVNGDSIVTYHNEISLSQPFIRNLDLIESDVVEYSIEQREE